MYLLSEIYYPSLISWCRGWLNLARDGHESLDIKIGTYEALIASEADYLADLVDFFDLPACDFARISDEGKRTPSTEEWREHLSPSQQNRLDEMLEGTGYTA